MRSGISINGLPILSLDPFLDRYYYNHVIGGPGAFMIPAANYENFADAVVKKLILEIAANEDRPADETMGRGPGRDAVKKPLTLLAIAAALIALCLPARADFQICNRMSYVVEAAVGLQESGALVTRGWYRVDPGQCRVTIEGAVNADHFYVHARALPAYGSSPSALTGHVELCVGKQHFIVPSARARLLAPGPAIGALHRGEALSERDRMDRLSCRGGGL